ncbi:hypothetical protein M422DRAFT_24211 [Sphaerobolus stellatus SS14]|nr:hypothetical protein M422DRAFT_24211 [Sphaerobolus stellatus SS14]
MDDQQEEEPAIQPWAAPIRAQFARMLPTAVASAHADWFGPWLSILSTVFPLHQGFQITPAFSTAPLAPAFALSGSAGGGTGPSIYYLVRHVSRHLSFGEEEEGEGRRGERVLCVVHVRAGDGGEVLGYPARRAEALGGLIRAMRGVVRDEDADAEGHVTGEGGDLGVEEEGRERKSKRLYGVQCLGERFVVLEMDVRTLEVVRGLPEDYDSERRTIVTAVPRSLWKYDVMSLKGAAKMRSVGTRVKEGWFTRFGSEWEERRGPEEEEKVLSDGDVYLVCDSSEDEL